MTGWFTFLTWLGIAKQTPKPRPVWFYSVHPLDTDPVMWIPSIADSKYTERVTLHAARTRELGVKAAKKAILRRGGVPREFQG